MDPLITVLVALQTGAIAKARSTTANEGVKVSYGHLREELQKRFKQQKVNDMALTEYEIAPSIWLSRLKQDLEEAGVDQDKNIIQIAEELLARVEPEQLPIGKYDTKVRTTVQGYGEGKFQELVMNFGSLVKEQQQKLDD